MCELLGMNCNVPTDICFSFQGFAARGGKTNHHQDGFGIAFFEQGGWRIFLDNQPAFKSPVAIENCHPFQRELWGKIWVFAHNGDLPDLKNESLNFYRPVGQTDSELAFCKLLDHLRGTFGQKMPSLEVLFPVLKKISDEITGEDGVFNYLLSNGEYLFAHCSTNLSYIVRQAPFKAAHLVDEDVAVDFSAVTSLNDRVAVIATKPLTDNEAWTAFKSGQLIAFQDGSASLTG